MESKMIQKVWTIISSYNRGKWKWLNSPQLSLAKMQQQYLKASLPSLGYYFLMSVAGIISTLGLLANSAAAIVGSMLLAPMMGAVLAVSFGALIDNRKLITRATFTLVMGILIVVVVSVAITLSLGIETLTAQINARINPTLIDLGVAIAAGAAGSFVMSHEDIADSLAGVAIAVALVPPLSVIGIGIALRSWQLSTGAGLLFASNLAGMLFSALVVFTLLGYGSFKESATQKGLILVLLLLIVSAIPLTVSLGDLLFEQRLSRSVGSIMRTDPFDSKERDEAAEVTVRKIFRKERPSKTKILGFVPTKIPHKKTEHLIVSLEVKTSEKITEEQVNSLQKKLNLKLKKPTDLSVRLVPVLNFEKIARVGN